ncbi:ribulokinase [Arthrobacter sp. Hiyo8]|nr:ribulokinase [Arthrobacter sp. Hiyo8]
MPVKEFIVAGGLLKNTLLMQIYADITGLPLSTIGSTQGPALGSAIHAAVAAGSTRTSGKPRLPWDPSPAPSTPRSRKTSPPTRNCSANTGPCMTTSAAERTRSCTGSRRSSGTRAKRSSPRGLRMSALLDTIATIRREVCALHAELTRYELVVWTAGNVSARVPGMT